VVGGQQFIEFDISTGGQVVAVLRQPPAGTFDHAPALAVGTQLVGLIDPHPVDDRLPYLATTWDRSDTLAAFGQCADTSRI